MPHNRHGYNRKGDFGHLWDSFSSFAKEKKLLDWGGALLGANFLSDIFGGGFIGLIMGALAGAAIAHFGSNLVSELGRISSSPDREINYRTRGRSVNGPEQNQVQELEQKPAPTQNLEVPPPAKTPAPTQELRENPNIIGR